MIITAYRPLSEEYKTFNDAKLTDIFQFINYDYRKLWDGVGNFTLEIPKNVAGADLITEDTILHVDNDDALVVRNITETERTYHYEGYDLKELLTRRTTLFPTEEFEAGTYGFDPAEGSTEYCIKHYIKRNITESEDSERGIFGFYIATNQDRGLQEDSYLSRLEQLDEVVGNLCKNAGIGWDIKLDLSRNRYVFDVYEPIDKTENQTENQKVIFAPFLLNMEGVTYNHGNANEKNAIYAVNGGQDEIFVQLVNRERENPAAGFERREVTVNINSDYDQIDAFALKAAEDMTETDSFEVFAGNISDYGVLYEIGDKVSFRYKNLELDAVITEAHKTFNGESKRIKITTGDKKPAVINAESSRLSTAKSDLKDNILNRKKSGGGEIKSKSDIFAFEKMPTTEQFNDIPYNSYVIIYDPERYDTHKGLKPVHSSYYKIQESEPTVTSVVIEPENQTIRRESWGYFSATVEGENDPSQEVNWELNSENGSTVNQSGSVYISNTEPVNQMLTVKASSVVNPEIYDTATIMVRAQLVLGNLPANDWSAVCYGDYNKADWFVTVANNSSNAIRASNNGKTWGIDSAQGNYFKAVCWGENDNMFVAVGVNLPYISISYSRDGTEFSTEDTTMFMAQSIANWTVSNVCNGKGIYVASVIPDWDTMPSVFNYLQNFNFASELVSNNGKQWEWGNRRHYNQRENLNLPIGVGCPAMCFDKENNRFIGLAMKLTQHAPDSPDFPIGTFRPYTSNNGRDWEIGDSFSGSPSSMAIGDGLIVAIGSNSIHVSRDAGNTWSSFSTPSGDTLSGRWFVAFQNNRFVAVKGSGTLNPLPAGVGIRAMYALSSQAHLQSGWNVANIGNNGDTWSGICGGNGRIVAVAKAIGSGTAAANRSMYTTNGITWY
ncbi:MAG: siphovirus ReqiPepy6 Gp37-like family protein [Oscillospiraceae bacterium]|nr:siphovirus ReqiPepy6 Gp37-like family protein [Oscillospiraceae bacterium]